MKPDEQIRNAFESQKRLDEQITPRFVVQATTTQPRWHYNLTTIAAAAAAVVATLLLTNLPSPQSPPPIAATPFEEASQSISLHLFAATTTDWQSPTDFLLNTDTTLPPQPQIPR